MHDSSPKIYLRWAHFQGSNLIAILKLVLLVGVFSVTSAKQGLNRNSPAAVYRLATLKGVEPPKNVILPFKICQWLLILATMESRHK
jgi:hypothetical protein